jgi:hypothetical protein
VGQRKLANDGYQLASLTFGTPFDDERPER